MEGLVGSSPAIHALRADIGRLTSRTQGLSRPPAVLIQGETGTGKGLVASLLHRMGSRAAGPFVDVNCAAIPETLLEAELFGYERGAFTDARRSKPGLFQTAHRGTLFLDEIALLPEALQAKLLKAIEERSVRRLGGTHAEPVDVWILSATNSDLANAVKQHRFREDLYHRLAVVTIALSPLRMLGNDIVLLAEHYLARACRDYGLPARVLAADARARLLTYRWPGNVRELANTMERAALLTETPDVTAAMLDLKEGVAEAARRPKAASLDQAMRDHVQTVLDQTGGNISRSAAILGITRNTLRSQMQKLGLRRGGGSARGPDSPVAPVESDEPARPESTEPFPVEVAAVPRVDAALAGPSAAVVLRWQRRLVTFLGMELAGPEGASSFQLAPVLGHLVGKLKNFGARVEELTPDRLVAVVGFDAVEDAPTRAAHAALTMLKALERRDGGGSVSPVTGRFAIHVRRCMAAQSGDVTGMDAGDRRAAWGVLDALIEQAHPQTILVDASSARFLERRFELQAAGVSSRGEAVHRVVGRERSGFEVGGVALSRFVDRERELAALRELLTRTEGGHGQVVGILGEPGVGKSRLLHEFKESLESGRVTYLEGRCLSYGIAIPYLPVIDIVRASFQLLETDAPDVVVAKVQSGVEALGLAPAASVPYLLHLLGSKEGAETVGSLSPDVIKIRTMEALRQMGIAGSSQRPIIFAVEDLQWIDQTSEEALASLAESLARCSIMLIATYRPGYRPPWMGRSYASQLGLDPLTPADSLAVVHSVIAERELGPELAGVIVSRADGVPFFLEELARAVADHPDLRSDVAVPDTIQGVLEARLDRLPETEKHLLQVASVVGKDVSVPLLQAVADVAEHELRRTLSPLQGAEFLVLKRVSPAEEYTFKHALTHEVAYQSNPGAQRRALHARVVEAIEQIYADRLSEHVDLLAHHAVHGEVWERAVTYLRRAGERALQSSANREASVFLGEALTALRHLPETPLTLGQAVDIRLSLRDALWALAQLPQIQDHLREAEILAETLGDRRRAGWIACYVCQHAWSVVRLDAALEAGERALAIAEDLPNPALRAETGFYLSLVHLALGDAGRAAEILSTNLRTLDSVVEAHRGEFPSPRFAANGPILVRGWVARVFAELGEFAAAETWGHEAIRLAEAANSPFALTTALAGLGASHVRRGNAESAIPPLERGLELCRTYHFKNWFPTVAASLGSAYTSIGRVGAGVAILEEAVEQGARAGIRSSHSLWLVYLGEAYLRAQRPADALNATQRARALCREHKEAGYEAWALRLLGEIAAHADRPDRQEAEAKYQEALALSERLRMRPLVARCQLGLGRLYERVGDRSGAEAYLERASSLYRELGMPLATHPGRL
jgi:transcriptional regulator with AAA-type ATPase domain/tetratricopeptide (TPR) repeat protein